MRAILRYSLGSMLLLPALSYAGTTRDTGFAFSDLSHLIGWSQGDWGAAAVFAFVLAGFVVGVLIGSTLIPPFEGWALAGCIVGAPHLERFPVSMQSIAVLFFLFWAASFWVGTLLWMLGDARFRYWNSLSFLELFQ